MDNNHPVYVVLGATGQTFGVDGSLSTLRPLPRRQPKKG